jgi:hypothetical protein
MSGTDTDTERTNVFYNGGGFMTLSSGPSDTNDAPLVKSEDGSTRSAVWHGLVTTITDPEFTTIAALCVIALLLTFNLILRFPDFGTVIAQCSQF